MSTLDRTTEERERVIVRFAGDSGDGMQLAGGQFTAATAAVGNDLVTLPDFPAEIRAPAGTTAGVSSFQIHFANRDIATPGDTPNLLVAMNPAALQANVAQLEPGAGIVVNEDAFTKRNLLKAGYQDSPLDDDSLAQFQVWRVPMTTMCQRAAEAIEGAATRDVQKSRNLFALGLICWMYDRPIDGTVRWISEKFAASEGVRDINLAALRAGWNFGETTEVIGTRVHVAPATDVRPGTYRNINGTQATSLGLIAASVRSGLPLCLAAYPITPASDLLHDLARRRDVGVRTVQAEDEIAAAGIALGASYGGALGVTATSGPGMDLKAETIGLAVMLELPLVIIDVQRAGPSTGMPTKTEQSDLLMALHGRHGESPLPVVAASTPGQLLQRRLRGGADRRPVPHAGHPAHRPVPGQQFGAVARADRRRPAGDRPRLRAARRSRHRVFALRARRARRAALGAARHARHPAPDRRPGEGRPGRLDQLRPRQPRPHDGAARREDRRGRRARRRRRRRRGRGGPRARLGLERRGGPRRRAAHPPAWPARRPRPPAPPATRCRPTSATCCAASAACWCLR